MKLDPHDNRANESALKTGARHLLRATSSTQRRIGFWIITDAVDIEAGDESAEAAIDDRSSPIGVLTHGHVWREQYVETRERQD